MSQHYKHIESIAEHALKLIDHDDAPIAINQIAEKLGLKVIVFDFHNNISGILKKDKKAIGVNKNHHPFRQRFSVAHELAHFLLGHEGYEDREFIDSNFDKPIPIEREANVLASYLLMPQALIKKYVDQKMDIPALSKQFQVSQQAMTIRLLEIGLIK